MKTRYAITLLTLALLGLAAGDASAFFHHGSCNTCNVASYYCQPNAFSAACVVRPISCNAFGMPCCNMGMGGCMPLGCNPCGGLPCCGNGMMGGACQAGCGPACAAAMGCYRPNPCWAPCMNLPPSPCVNMACPPMQPPCGPTCAPPAPMAQDPGQNCGEKKKSWFHKMCHRRLGCEPQSAPAAASCAPVEMPNPAWPTKDCDTCAKEKTITAPVWTAEKKEHCETCPTPAPAPVVWKATPCEPCAQPASCEPCAQPAPVCAPAVTCTPAPVQCECANPAPACAPATCECAPETSCGCSCEKAPKESWWKRYSHHPKKSEEECCPTTECCPPEQCSACDSASPAPETKIVPQPTVIKEKPATSAAPRP